MHTRRVVAVGPRLAAGIFIVLLTASAGTALAAGYELTGVAGPLVVDDNQNSGWPTLENFQVSFITTPMYGEFPSTFGSNVLFPDENWLFNATDTSFIESEGFPGFSSYLDAVTVNYTASTSPSVDSTMVVQADYLDNWEILINLSFPYGFDGVGGFDPNGANSIVITGPADTLTYDVSSAQNNVPEPVSASLLLAPVGFLAGRRRRR